jgi:putative spermidine/putrescine transport system substrate-binding protein
VQLKFSPTEQLKDLFNQLQWSQQQTTKPNDWRSWIPLNQSRSVTLADLATLGDYWLAPAIQQRLIQPLDPSELREWQQLPERWQKLVTRNEKGQLDTQGKVWAAPYRWGSTVIAYNQDKFKSLGWIPRDWSDLWRPELRGRLSLLAQPREVIGLTLKKLGQSYNIKNLDIPELKDELRTLNQQVKFYSSNTYIEPLIMEDTWVAVGWSTDILPVMQFHPQIAAVIPQSGTAIWADLWVRPASNSNSFNNSLIAQWIDFCWQPQFARQISLQSRGTSPIPVMLQSSDMQKQSRSLLLIDPKVFQLSEFLLPLPEVTMQEYNSLWQSITSS